MKKLIWLCCLGLVFVGQSALTADKVNRIYLKSNDRDVKAIVIAEKATGAATFAAEELQRYIRQVTGAALLPILKDTNPNVPKPAILVGPSKLTKDLGLDEQKLHPEGFFLKTTPDYLVIAGNDHPAWTKEIFDKKEWVFMGDIQREAGTRIGTLFGVYTFLQEFAGVGWFFAGPLGEVVPKDQDIVIPDLDRMGHPEFETRGLGMHPENVGELPYPECESFADREVRRFSLRLRTGCSRTIWHNHALWYWGALFGKEHPEYFALVNGKRLNDWGWNGKNRGGQNCDFCWANPAMIQQQCAEMRFFFNGEIERHKWVWIYADKAAYPIVANDGIMKPCECKFCSQWNGPKRGYRGSLSDVYAYHLSEVAKVAEKEFPDKFVVGLAYGPRVLPPEKIQLPKNVMVSFAYVSPATMLNPATKKGIDEIVDAWCKITTIPAIWEYTDMFRYFTPNMPLVIPRAVGQELKSRKGKTRGFYFSAGPSDAFSQPERYVAGQLMWDVDQDVDALLERFFNRLYGPAEKPVKEIYQYLESLWTEEMQTFSPPVDPTQGINAPNWKRYPKERVWKNVFTADRMLKIFPLLENAKKLAGEDRTVLLRLARLERDIKLAFAEACRVKFGILKAKEKAGSQPALSCPKVETAPVIDGTLSDAAWEKALTGKMENILLGKGKPASETKLWVCRDSENLYVAVECAEPIMAQLVAIKGKESPRDTVFSNDDLEIFIDLASSLANYYQIGVDAAGQAAAFYCQEGVTSPKPVAIKVKVAVEKKENAWIAEIKIPFSEVGGVPAPGSRWGINIVRNRQAKESSPQELSGWFPNAKGQFHSPEDFGRLTF